MDDAAAGSGTASVTGAPPAADDLVAGFCGFCGRPLSAGGHEACLRRAALEPPRYCGRCARRMVVQVTPTGWAARCSRHGVVTA